MHAPQIITIILFALGSGITLSKNGEPKTGEHSFLMDIFGTSIVVGLLYWGGFFSQP